ncbi:EamA family transporter [Pelagicola sp. LXJ1103]|nr:EamA family transporter [Pelagicola sp. LXJ1103]
MRAGMVGTLSMVVLLGLMWGLNWPAVKYLLSDMPPFTLRAFGFTCAAIALVGIVRALGHTMRPAPGEARALLLTGGFIVFGFNLLTALGQLFTPASEAAIIAYTMPAMTAILSALFLGEVLHRRHVLAIFISLAGLVLLASADLAHFFAAPLGPALMFGAALSWAIGNVMMRAQVWTLSPLVRVAWFFVISAAMIWPFALIFERQSALTLPSRDVLWIFAYHVCGPMVACYVLWTVILGRLPATVAAISTLIAPVVGVISAVWLLGEEMPWQKTLALVLIVTSIALTLLRPASEQR